MTTKTIIPYLVTLSGLAALTWEVLWQIKISLSLGISSWGTALTLAITMGGMSIGALLAARILQDKQISKPLRLYGILEIVIGLSGLALNHAFQSIETLDTFTYNAFPSAIFLIFVSGVIITLAIPTLSLGATIPVLGIASRQYKTSLAFIYGLNTLGAAAGTLIAALVLIPALGITHTIYIVSALNIIVGITAILIESKDVQTSKPDISKDTTKKATTPSLTFSKALLAIFVTGYATFALEIAWFRSLTTAFMSTTDAFAIMLACVLLGLGAGAQLSHLLKMKNIAIGNVMAIAGIFILLMTPLIERFDTVTTGWTATNGIDLLTTWFFMTLITVGLPITLLGTILPWLLNEQETPKKWGTLYGLNAFASIIGALTAAWLLLPTIGFAATAWSTGVLVIAAGAILTQEEKRSISIFVTSLVAFTIAVSMNSGAGIKRVQGDVSFIGAPKDNTILAYHEGPDATVAAIENKSKWRALVINGFIATAQNSDTKNDMSANYMRWMGHLPMLVHPNPKNALIIAFGTGQTANAVRKENPETIDIVDLNKHVLKIAPVFTTNENVLEDPRVTTHIMDGRAYIRRTNKKYDVITLEPMPPNFAGVNALYSHEFYQAADEKMTEEAIIAQWLPFHLVAPEYSRAIAKTMKAVFPNTVLWVDPQSKTGILIASKNKQQKIGNKLYGFQRTPINRSMSEQDVKKAFILNREEIESYINNASVINDDNQLLAYGRAVYLSHHYKDLDSANQIILKDLTSQ